MAKGSSRLLLVSDGVGQQVDYKAGLQYDASDQKELQRAVKGVSKRQAREGTRGLAELTMILSNLEWRASLSRFRASSSLLR